MLAFYSGSLTFEHGTWPCIKIWFSDKEPWLQVISLASKYLDEACEPSPVACHWNLVCLCCLIHQGVFSQVYRSKPFQMDTDINTF